MEQPNIEQIKDILYKYYSIESESEAEQGCYISGNWLSIAQIIKILENNINF